MYAQDDDKKTVRIGLYDNEPKVFTDSEGKPAGIFIDILEYIAEKENWKLDYRPGTWGEGLDRLEKGEIDLMPDVAYTAEREKIFSYHKVPVLSSWFQVYARRGSGIQSILDLDGKRVVVLERSVQEESFRHLTEGLGLDIVLMPLPDYNSSFEMVSRGKADAAITNRFYGLTHAEEYGLEDTAVIINPSSLFFAAPAGSGGELLDVIDSHLAELKKDTQSVYYLSLKEWISEDVKFVFPGWVKFAVFLVILLFFFTLSGTYLLKYQVKSRTEELSRHNAQMLVLDRTLRRTTTQFDLTAILENFLEGAINLAKVDSGAVYLADSRAGEFIRSAAINIPEDEKSRFDLSFQLVVLDETIGKLSLFSDREINIDKLTSDLLNNLCSTIALTITNARLYSQVKNHEEQLESLVGERTAELKIAMEKAQAADMIKSAFLATMSHELRTPLNSIIGFTGILLQNLAGPLNDEQRKQLSMVQGSARHLLDLINDVLDISKIEAGQLTLSVSAFNVKGSVEKVLNMVMPMAEKKGLTLVTEIGEDVGTSMTDQRRLEQVVLNLLNNAVKFTEQGFISLSCRKEGDKYLLSVADSGIGIKKEDIEGLFQPFHQLDTGLSRKHEGTGLGLSICRKLLNMMGGDISVRSKPGEGSTFTISFPGEKGVQS